MATHAHLADAAPRQRADVDAPALDERDPHVIFFTSGSTGRSKGVVLSHRASCLRSFPPLGADTDGGTVCMFPLFHMAGWSLALGCWQSRRPIHFVQTPDAETLLRTAERRRRHPDLPDPGGVVPRARPRREGLRPVVARRGRHRHVGDAARAHRGRP